jgi:small-conductance mechanosensitive channel
MSLSVLDSVLPPLWILLLFVVAAVVVRLLWRRVLVRGQELARPGRWLAEHTTTPVFLLLLALGAQLAVSIVTGPQEIARLRFTPYLRGAAYIFTVVCATWVAYGLVKGLSAWYLARAAQRADRTLDVDLMPAFRRVAQVVLVFVALTVILDHYDVRLTALLGAAGVASLAVALAAQDTIANMIAGFNIMADRPFRLGDRVELPGGRLGDVQEIGLRSTKILSPDNTMHIIPNSEIAKSSVVNHSYPNGRANVWLRIAVAYDSDPAQVKQIVANVCRAHPEVLPAPPADAFLGELAETSMHIQFNFWIEDFRMRAKIVDEIQTAIHERLSREGIYFPVPPMEARKRRGENPA